MDWIAHVTEALFSTYRDASKLLDDILAVEGYSSPLVRRLLNNLCDFDGCRYVEVGTWQGATALSASYLNRGSFTAIDNFGESGGPREVCLRNRARWRAQCHFELIDADVWSSRGLTQHPVTTASIVRADGSVATRSLMECLARRGFPAMAMTGTIVEAKEELNRGNWLGGQVRSLSSSMGERIRDSTLPTGAAVTSARSAFPWRRQTCPTRPPSFA
jgi:hypothetical protein